MQIGEVLSRAWNIVWKHKVLWIFGILVGFSGGNTTSSYSLTSQDTAQYSPQFENFVSQFQNWQIALFIAIAVLVILLLVVLAVFLSTMGRIGIIRGTQQADQGAEKLSFSELFRGGLPFFWRVFGLNLVVGLAIALIVILIVIASIPLAISVIGLFCLIPLVCLLVPAGFLVSILVQQANNSMVIEGKGIRDSLARGWEITRANLGQFILLGLILMLISLVAGFVIGIPFAIFLGPLAAGWIIGTNVSLSSGALITGLCLVGYLPVLFFLNGSLQSYIYSAWTLAFLRLTTPKAMIEPNSSPVQ